MLEAFNLVVDGVPWNEVGLLGNPIDVAMDIRAYYEEAAIALVDHVPSAQSGVSWLYQKTETGALMRAAQMEIKKQNLPYGPDTVSAPAGGYPPASRLWYYIMPQIQSDATFLDGINYLSPNKSLNCSSVNASFSCLRSDSSRRSLSESLNLALRRAIDSSRLPEITGFSSLSFPIVLTFPGSNLIN